MYTPCKDYCNIRSESGLMEIYGDLTTIQINLRVMPDGVGQKPSKNRVTSDRA